MIDCIQFPCSWKDITTSNIRVCRIVMLQDWVGSGQHGAQWNSRFCGFSNIRPQLRTIYIERYTWLLYLLYGWNYLGFDRSNPPPGHAPARTIAAARIALRSLLNFLNRKFLALYSYRDPAERSRECFLAAVKEVANFYSIPSSSGTYNDSSPSDAYM